MRHIKTGWSLAVFSIIAMAGCSARSQDQLTLNGDKSVKKESTLTPIQRDAREDLAAVEKQIVAKEKELADLRRKADTLRSQAIGPASLSALQKLMDAIPADSRPRKNDEIAMIKANKWFEANMLGKVVELRTVVREVRVSANGDSYYVVAVLGDLIPDAQKLIALHPGNSNIGFPGKVVAGVDEWSIFITPVVWENLDEAGARRIQDMKGKTATVSFTNEAGNIFVSTTILYLAGGFVHFAEPNPLYGWSGPILFLCPTNATIDGYDPTKK